MPSQDSITLLHVSDMQFGRNHRFGIPFAAGDPDAELDTLFARLDDDLKRLANDEGLRPQIVIVSGDLAEWGRASELDDAFEFLDRLATSLSLPRNKVVVVPRQPRCRPKSLPGVLPGMRERRARSRAAVRAQVGALP